MTAPSERKSTLGAWLLFLGLTVLVGGVDLWTKHAVFEMLDVHVVDDPPRVASQSVVTVIPDWFELEATFNLGAFSGWFSGHTGKLALLSALAVVVIVTILAVSLRGKTPPGVMFVVALGLICGGTIGNLYDRWQLGAVRDWIKWFVVIDGEEKVWPNFNIADSLLVCGAALLMWQAFTEPSGTSDAPADAGR